jgi:cytochrome P450
MVEIVDEMLAAASGQSELCVIDTLAYPLPVIIIAEMLGIPAEDRDRFRHWSDEVVRGLGIATLDDLRASIRAGRELVAYLEPIAEARRREPRDDLLSGLLQAEEAGDRLTMGEVFQTVILLLVAGNETTTKLIGNGLLALLQHPAQLALLRERPDLIDTAVEELLRSDGPVHATGRAALESFQFQGAEIEKGQMVMMGISGARTWLSVASPGSPYTSRPRSTDARQERSPRTPACTPGAGSRGWRGVRSRRRPAPA